MQDEDEAAAKRGEAWGCHSLGEFYSRAMEEGRREMGLGAEEVAVFRDYMHR